MLNEIVNFQLNDFQNATDQLIKPKSILIWHTYLTTMFEDVPEANVNLNKDMILTTKPELEYFQNVVQLIAENITTQEMELYIWWSIVEELVLYTTSDIRKLHNDYLQKISSIDGRQSRSMYCTHGVNQLLGMAVSHAFVSDQFENVTRPNVMTMLQFIRETFNNFVRWTTWMDDSTKCATLEKSEAMKSFIGYPDWVGDRKKLDEHFAGVRLNASTHLANVIDVLQWQIRKELKEFRDVPHVNWATAPTHVNAFHTFFSNAISKFVVFS